jgi:glycosyltransferase involved in cell wall biosynthesis
MSALKVLVFHELSDRRRMLEEAMAGLRADGVDVIVATLRPSGPFHERLRELGISAHSLDCQSSRGYPLAALRLARLARAEAVDVIHSIEPIPATIGGQAGMLARRPARLFHWQHSAAYGHQALFSRAGARLSGMVMACSEFAARVAIEEQGVAAEKVRVAHNGVPQLRRVDDGEVQRLRQGLAIPAEAPLVVAVSRLRPEKGLAHLVDAVEPVRSARPDVQLVIAGSGPEEPDLRERARALSAPVHFVGHQDDVAPWFAAADVVAVPSLRDALPFSAAEAMSCAQPLVASRVGGLPELVVDGETGRLVGPGDPQGLAAAIIELLEDPALARRMGEAGYRRYQERFTVDAMVAGWSRCYRELSQPPV